MLLFPPWRGLCYGIRCELFPVSPLYFHTSSGDSGLVSWFDGCTPRRWCAPVYLRALIRDRHLLERVGTVFTLLEHSHERPEQMRQWETVIRYWEAWENLAIERIVYIKRIPNK